VARQPSRVENRFAKRWSLAVKETVPRSVLPRTDIGLRKTQLADPHAARRSTELGRAGGAGARAARRSSFGLPAGGSC
jgi:hypothetical protein